MGAAPVEDERRRLMEVADAAGGQPSARSGISFVSFLLGSYGGSYFFSPK